jgi:alpha-amylase/alpha-mannosidase (GH57 family)
VIPLKVAILWHQHQPLYRSTRTGRYALPWVRLHGLKDYYDMAALAAEFPALRLTFNLVPSLLDQLDDYVMGRADDPALDLARRPAADLTEDEVLAMLDLFFSVPYGTLISPYPRYAALFHKRGGRGPDGEYRDALPRFRKHDLRDLQVWFHLAWSGETLKRRPAVRELLRKGDNFTEQEKNALLDLQAEFLKEILPLHARLRAEGIAELSTSPYYHPILPLLCNLESAREAIHDLPLPSVPFRRPGDARVHVLEALDAMQRRFGARPTGMWPSEGSLSEEVLALMGQCGVSWVATDEGILRHSVGASGGHFRHEMIYAPHRSAAAGEGSPVIFFRDQTLSDLIGFTYASWPAAQAAEDFLGRLRGIGHRAPGGVVSVILDGENAWEHYPNNAVDFLRALYRGLTTDPQLRPVTMDEAMREVPAGTVGRLRAGSWIGSNFTTWIGHPEKNRAWAMLAAARQKADWKFGADLPRRDDPPARRVWEALAAAEGSDWFWWFGDDHSSEQDAIFDAAFRDQLRSVYEAIGAEAPAELDRPIKQQAAQRVWTEPTGWVHPVLDGEVSDYFEWLPAGECDALYGQGAMHQASGLIRRIQFGCDEKCLYVRVDPDRGTLRDLLARVPESALVLRVTAPAPIEATFRPTARAVEGPPPEVARFAAGKVLEVQLPLTAGADAGAVEFHVSLMTGGRLVQRLPRDGAIRVPRAEPIDWRV